MKNLTNQPYKVLAVKRYLPCIVTLLLIAFQSTGNAQSNVYVEDKIHWSPNGGLHPNFEIVKTNNDHALNFRLHYKPHVSSDITYFDGIKWFWHIPVAHGNIVTKLEFLADKLAFMSPSFFDSDVGIGIESPQYPLHVLDKIAIEGYEGGLLLKSTEPYGNNWTLSSRLNGQFAIEGPDYTSFKIGDNGIAILQSNPTAGNSSLMLSEGSSPYNQWQLTTLDNGNFQIRNIMLNLSDDRTPLTISRQGQGANLNALIEIQGDIQTSGDIKTDGALNLFSTGTDPGIADVVSQYGAIDLSLDDDDDDAYSIGDSKAGMYGATYYDGDQSIGNMLSFYVTDPNATSLDEDYTADMKLFDDGTLMLEGSLNISGFETASTTTTDDNQNEWYHLHFSRPDIDIENSSGPQFDFDGDLNVKSGGGASVSLLNTYSDIKWEVVSGVSGGFEIGNVTDALTDTNAPFFISREGTVGINITAPSLDLDYKLHVSGDTRLAGDLLVGSSTNTVSITQQGGIIATGDGAATNTIDSKIDGTIVMGGEDGSVITNSDINASYYSSYALWVEHGIVTEDIAYAPRDLWDADDTDDDSGLDWPDYVFSKNYQLRSLEDLKAFIDQNSHLPDVPSATQINKDGFSLIKMDMNLLRKVEELVLYTLEQESKLKSMESRLHELESLLKTGKTSIDPGK